MSGPKIINFLDMLLNMAGWQEEWNLNAGYAKNALRTFHATMVNGDPVTPYNVSIQLQDAEGNNVAETTIMRVRITDWATYTPSILKTFAATGSTTLLETKTANTDLILKSNASGLITFDVTNPGYGGFKVLLGADVLGPQFANYNNSLSFDGYPLLNMAGNPIFNMAGQPLFHA